MPPGSKPTHTESTKYIRTRIDLPEITTKRMIKVIRHHLDLDNRSAKAANVTQQ